ncbi:tyrosine-type recombinase/integrase, partial [Chloroflexota bacterium]
MKPGKTTVADYLQRWLSDYAKPNLSPRGFERYESIARVHLIPNLGSLPLVQLKPEHLQRHYSTMLQSSLNPGSIRYHHVVLHKALATAVKWGLVSRNVADSVDVPRPRRSEMQTWDESELSIFLEAAKGTQYYALFYTALYTGMRRSELLALRWQDIDFIYGRIYVSRSLHHLKDGSYIFTQPKSDKSRRTIALPPSAFLVLSEYRKQKEAEALLLGTSVKDDDLVFSTLGKPYRPNTITRAWSMLAAKAGVKVIRLHDARHTHASLMLKQGIHPKVVQERL